MPEYMEDYEEACPKCGHCPIHWRHCEAVGCDDGYVDVYEEDPLWYDPGDTERCEECRGTGIERWRPKCGANLSGVSVQAQAEAEYYD